MPSASKPWSRPNACSVATSPAALLPNRKLAPTTTDRGVHGVDQHPLGELLGRPRRPCRGRTAAPARGRRRPRRAARRGARSWSAGSARARGAAPPSGAGRTSPPPPAARARRRSRGPGPARAGARGGRRRSCRSPPTVRPEVGRHLGERAPDLHGRETTCGRLRTSPSSQCTVRSSASWAVRAGRGPCHANPHVAQRAASPGASRSSLVTPTSRRPPGRRRGRAGGGRGRAAVARDVVQPGADVVEPPRWLPAERVGGPDPVRPLQQLPEGATSSWTRSSVGSCPRVSRAVDTGVQEAHGRRRARRLSPVDIRATSTYG